VDLALAMTRRIQQAVRPDLKIVVMSATLDAGPIAAYLGDCPLVTAEGRLFPVEVEYFEAAGSLAGASQRQKGGSAGRSVAIERAVEHGLAKSPGDILVFLPGVGEIRRASEDLESLARRHGLAIMPLYGDLPAEQQDLVLAPSDRRKLILATNVAET